MRHIDLNTGTAGVGQLQPCINVIVVAVLDPHERMHAPFEEVSYAACSLLPGIMHTEASAARTIACRILDQLGGVVPVPPASPAIPAMQSPTCDELSPRERDVLQLMTEGLRNQEIARRLGIKEKTVRNHVSNILAKLQVEDRSQAVALALRGRLAEFRTLTPRVALVS